MKAKQSIARYMVCSLFLLGSLSATNRNAGSNNTTFYVTGSANYANGESAIGLVVMVDGFDVNASAAVTFNIVVPVSGPCVFGDNAYMTLDGDLYFAKDASMTIGTTGGHGVSWNGNGHGVYFDGDMTLPASRTIYVVNTDICIDGRGHVLTFGDGSSIFNISAGKTLTLRNMVINGLTGSSQFTGSGNVRFENVIINIDPGNVWTWNNSGTLHVLGDMIVRGRGTFSFDNGSMTINQRSRLIMDVDSTFRWNNSNRDALTMTDESSVLCLDWATINAESVTNNGLRLQKGSVWFKNKSPVDNDGNSSAAKSFELGDGASSSNDVTVKVFGGALVEVDGFLKHNPA